MAFINDMELKKPQAESITVNSKGKLEKVLYKTSVIIPVFNEATIIDLTLDAVSEFAAENPDFYFLFVNDCSSDNSGNIIKQRIKGIPNVELIESTQNRGKVGALKLALHRLETDCICFTDGDMAYSLEHLHLLTESLKTNDIAIGCRRLTDNKQPNSVKRALAGETFNRAVRLLLNLPYRDTQAGIKGFRMDVAKRLFALSKVNNFSFDAELLYIAKLKGYSVGEIPAKVSEAHQELPSTVKVFRDSPSMFISLLSILAYRMLGRYNG
jgi:glycosyltransferase involved in cell wall biosynthesis